MNEENGNNENDRKNKKYSNAEKFAIFVLSIVTIFFFLSLFPNPLSNFKATLIIDESGLTITKENKEEKVGGEEKQNTSIKDDDETKNNIKSERFIKYDGEENLNNFLQKNELVLLEFRVGWCPYCLELERRIPDILEKNKKLIVLQIDMENNRNLADSFSIISTPTLVLYHNGEEKGEVLGALPTGDILYWIDEAIKEN